LKISLAYPIPKNDGKKKNKDYRPVSIINVIPKFFSKKKVYKFVYNQIQHLISPRQFGFAEKCSTAIKA